MIGPLESSERCACTESAAGGVVRACDANEYSCLRAAGGHARLWAAAAVEQVEGKQDTFVWAAAQAGGRMLVTCDLDFSDVRMFCARYSSGILLARLPDE